MDGPAAPFSYLSNIPLDPTMAHLLYMTCSDGQGLPRVTRAFAHSLIRSTRQGGGGALKTPRHTRGAHGQSSGGVRVRDETFRCRVKVALRRGLYDAAFKAGFNRVRGVHGPRHLPAGRPPPDTPSDFWSLYRSPRGGIYPRNPGFFEPPPTKGPSSDTVRFVDHSLSTCLKALQ